MKSNLIERSFRMFRVCRAVLCIWSVSCGFTRGELAADEGQLANRIVQSAGITRGLCVHLDCGDGQLTAALGNHPALTVHGLEANPLLAARARRLIDSQERHGRVSVASGEFVRFPYVDGSVNLLVAPRVGTRGAEVKRLREIVRVMAPKGVGLLGGWNDNHKALEEAVGELRSAGLADVKSVGIDGTWLRFVKPRPKGMDDWTHRNHNAGGNRVSQDTLAGPPTRLRWVDGPGWSTEANGPGAALSIDGQLLYHFDEAPPGRSQQSWSAIYARDASNGLLHWKRRVESFNPLCFVATKRYVFSVVQNKGNLVALDRMTGKVAIEYDAASFPDWVVFHHGDLFMSAGARYSRRLMCIDAETGRVKWRSELGIQPSGALPNFVIEGELGYYLDWQRRALGCVELATGKPQWEQDVSGVLTGLKWRYGLCSHGHGTLVVGEGMKGRGVHAFADKDGKHLWSRQYTLVVSGRGQRHKGSTFDDGFFIDGLYWTHVGLPRDAKGKTIGALAWEGLDPTTGAVRRRFAYPEGVVVGDSCHRTQATVNYFMGGHSRFVSTSTGEYVPRAYGIHNSCRFGMLPANGLTYTWSQYTDSYVRGVMGLATGHDGQDQQLDHSERLVKGPAFAAVEHGGQDVDAWPCFRRDSQRSARSPSNAFQAKPSLLWQAKLGSGLSPPVAVGDLVFASQPDASRVIAVRAGSGDVAWKFLTSGRVTTPPTIHQGLCLFGCADGWAYCLRASDGELVWRFRAARREELIVDRGRLASVWPVESGVLVDGGLALFAAGRHGTLDDGVDLYALKPATGELVWARRSTDTPVVSLSASDGTSFSLGGKVAHDLHTGESRSRPSFSPAVYRQDAIDLTQRLGPKGDDLRSHPTLNVVASAVVRAGDVALVAGRLKEQPPALTWVKQRNSVLIDEDVSARHDPETQFHLWAFSTHDGKLLWTQPLPAAPTFDAIAVYNENIYTSTVDGQLFRFALKP